MKKILNKFSNLKSNIKIKDKMKLMLNKNIDLMKYFRVPRLIPDEIYYITALHHLNKNFLLQFQENQIDL